MLSALHRSLINPSLISITSKWLSPATSHCPAFMTLPCRWAGHSHWQNVQHIKKAKDKEKAKTIESSIRNINNAIKVGGGSRDPNANSSLASAIKQSRAFGVPQTTIAKILSNDLFSDPYIIELRAQGGIFVLVESCNKHLIKEKQKIRSISKKFSCDIVEGVAGKITSEFFDHDGFVVCNDNDSLLSCLDSATEVGIDLGVQDVEKINSDEETFYQFQCATNEVSQLQFSLEERGISVLEAEDRYTPKNPVQVTSETQKLLQSMYDRFYREVETVNRVFDNVEVIEEGVRETQKTN